MSDQIDLLAKKLKTSASDARVTFTSNSADIRNYFVLHQLAFKHATKPVRQLAYLLDKSTYVLVASLWEAYCEDVVTECLDHIAAHAPMYQSLPPSIIEDIQKNIRSGKGSPWDLAGDGWREYIRQRGKGDERKRNKDFAGPKSSAVEQFFLRFLGVEDLCGRWQSSGSPLICDELDKHLDQRCTRGRPSARSAHASASGVPVELARRLFRLGTAGDAALPPARSARTGSSSGPGAGARSGGFPTARFRDGRLAPTRTAARSAKRSARSRAYWRRSAPRARAMSAMMPLNRTMRVAGMSPAARWRVRLTAGVVTRAPPRCSCVR